MRRAWVRALLALGFLVSGYFLWRFIEASRGADLSTQLARVTAGALLAAVVFQLLAHSLRAKKSQLLLQVIRPVGFEPLFRGVSLGFLWNTLLPFRVGELVRAHEVGRQMAISRAAVLFTILFERAVDGLVLATFAFLLSVTWVGPRSDSLSALLGLAGGVALISVAVAATALIFYRQDPRILRWLGKGTSLLNERLRDRARFILWSMIHGMHRVFREAPLGRYILLSVVMWILYVASVLGVVRDLSPDAPFAGQLGTALAAYFAVSIPSGPAYLGTFHLYFSRVARGLLGSADASIALSLVSWGVLMVPMMVVSVAFLMRGRRQPLPETSAQALDGLRNKLHRDFDVSREFSQFLDAYFSGQELSRLLSAHELRGEFQLIKTFRGGSNASTLLVWEEGQLFVKKLTLRQHAEKLRAQYEWLQRYAALPQLPRVSREVQAADSYAFNLEYREGYVPFFDFLHSESLERSQQVIESVLDFMYASIYRLDARVNGRAELDRYVAEKVLDKVRDAAAMNEALRALLAFDELEINGKKYDGLQRALDRLQRTPRALAELSTFHMSPIHGDLTVDNIIVSRETGAFLLLDPNNENAISDPVVDLGKLYQSLHSGYEFLCQLTGVRVDGNRIQFEENASSRYADLFAFLRGTLERRCTPESMRSVLFHEAVHYCRMLTYRARINPATLPAFFAVAIKLLNEFNAQYPSPGGERWTAPGVSQEGATDHEHGATQA